jgi:hypothetical protein
MQREGHCSKTTEALASMLERAVAAGAPISSAAEWEIQNALGLLRREASPELLQRVEQISAILFALARSRQHGRFKLYLARIFRL